MLTVGETHPNVNLVPRVSHPAVVPLSERGGKMRDPENEGVQMYAFSNEILHGKDYNNKLRGSLFSFVIHLNGRLSVG